MKGTELILGTAMWGWSISRKTAFSILDAFYESGHRHIDTATNYPINKDPNDFRFAENLLAEWIQHRNPEPLKIIVKIGSLSNDGAARNDLSPSFIADSETYYRKRFGPHLNALCLHWDNRDAPAEIAASLEALAKTTDARELWVSGIKEPSAYAKALSGLKRRLNIQVKSNLFYSDIPRHQPLHSQADFFVYGINAGGIGITGEYTPRSSVRLRGVDPSKYSERIDFLHGLINQSSNLGFKLSTFNELALLNAFETHGVRGVIIGPSKVEQLMRTLDFLYRLRAAHNERPYKNVLQKLWDKS